MKKKLKAISDGQPECSDPVKKMTTTTTTATKQKPRWKWSGEDEPQSEYCDEDTDTMTLTVGEQRRIQINHANAHKEWHNADEDEDDVQHVPFMNLTKDERKKKSTQFKFGLCSDCDAGLDDQIEFVCLNKGAFMCNACHDYYNRVALTGCGGGCN